MKILSSPGLVVMAAFVGVVFCQTTPPQEQHHQIPVVGLGSVSPIGTSALRRLSSNSTRSSRESRRAGSAEADLVEALEADKEVTVLGSVEVGELACHTLVVAEDASMLSFITHESESIVAERLSYTVTSGDAFTDGIVRKVWVGTVTEPAQAEDEAVPRVVSMTWGEVCDTETFLLKVTKRNTDGTTTITKTVPCDDGSSAHTCVVEILVEFDESSDAVSPDGILPAAGTASSDTYSSSTTDGRSTGEADPTSSSSPSDRRLQDAEDTVIDIMVLYSGPALATLGGITSQQMETIIAESIAESNQALINSAISANFNPVHIGPLPYEAFTSDDEYTLLELRYSDEVADLRDSTGADLVQLVGDFEDSCGRGYLFLNDESYAFSVVHATCIDNHSHTHELGHNLGCSHNRESSDFDLDYAHGLRYCDGDDQYRTLLSYSCGSPRINYFSNPDVEYLNKPTGTTTEDNARAFKDNMVAVSNFRVRSAEILNTYLYLGCFADDVKDRVLSGGFAKSDQVTVECFCGFSDDDPDELGDATCDRECAGDASQTCGGFKAISIYQYSVGPAEYVGCWKDSGSDRIMELVLLDSSMTNDQCADSCRGAYAFYGTQNAEECWCGGASTDYTAHGESTACDMECPGEADTVCPCTRDNARLPWPGGRVPGKFGSCLCVAVCR